MAYQALQPEQLYELWPCNAASWDAWCGVQTQWRHGHAGPTGLDYQGVSIYLDIALPDVSKKQEIFADLQACEVAALAAMRKRAKASK